MTGDTSTFTTSANNWHVIVGSKVYFGVMKNTGNSRGVLCWDMSTMATCGFTALSTTGRNTTVSNSFGVVQFGDLIYTADFFTGDIGIKVYCFNTSTNAMCSGFTTAGFNSGVVAGNPIVLSNVSGKLFVAGSGSTAANSLSCFDVNTTTGALSLCSGTWPIVGGPAYSGPRAHYTTAGVVDGFCLFGTNLGTQKCYDMNGTNTTATMLPAVSTKVNSYVVGNDIHFGNKVIYPSYGNSASVCWDYSINNFCVGFTDGGAGAVAGVRRWQYPNVGSTTVGAVGKTSDYGYTLYNNCGYGLGDSGLLWTFNLTDGKSPCSNADAKLAQKVDPSPPYCDGTPGPVLTAWDKLLPSGGAYPAGVGPVTVSIYTDNTYLTTVAGFNAVNVPATGLDLSSLSIATFPQLFIKLTMPNTTGSAFDMVTTYVLDQSQKYIFCFKAKVPDKCELDPIVNTAKVTDSAGTVSTTSTIAVDNKASCPVKPSIVKKMKDQATGSTTISSQDAIVENSLELVNSSGSITVDTTIDPLATNQSLVNGTLKVPNGWTKLYSTDGVTFTSIEPASGVTKVKSTGQNAPYRSGDLTVVNSGILGLTAPAVVGSSTVGPATLALPTTYCNGTSAPGLVSWTKVFPTKGVYTGGATATFTAYTDNTYTTAIAGFNNVNVQATGLDISSIDTAVYPQLFYKIVITNPAGTTFDMTISYLLTTPEKYFVCFDSKIANICDINSITNTASVTNANVTENGSATLTIDNSAICISSYGDFVWQDNNGNGIQDTGEPGVEDVSVILYNSLDDTAVDQTETDVNGKYLFTGIPSNKSYYVKFSNLPANYNISPKSVLTGTGTVSNNSDADIAMYTTGDTLVKNGISYLDDGDMGLVPTLVNIGDFIWVDTNKNGVQDSGEIGLPGVTVTLKDKTGATVGTPVITDANGKYGFTNLIPATGYYIELSTIPTDYVSSPQLSTIATATTLNDSNVDPVTHKSTAFDVVSGADDLSIDGGFYKLVPPVPFNDIISTPVNTPITLTPTDGDSDPDGDPITLTGIGGTPLTNTPNTTQVVTVPNGSISITYGPTGTPTITFTPNENFVGVFNIPYTITDGNGHTSTGYEQITVTPKPPVPSNDKITTTLDGGDNVDLIGNDKDPNGQKLKVSKIGTTDIDCSSAKTFEVAVEGGVVVVTCDSSGNATFKVNVTDPSKTHIDIPYTVVNESGLTASAVLGIDIVVNTVTTKIYDPDKLDDPKKIPDVNNAKDLKSLSDPYACGGDIHGFVDYTGDMKNITLTIILERVSDNARYDVPVTFDVSTGKYIGKVDYSKYKDGDYKIIYKAIDKYGNFSDGWYVAKIQTKCILTTTGANFELNNILYGIMLIMLSLSLACKINLRGKLL